MEVKLGSPWGQVAGVGPLRTWLAPGSRVKPLWQLDFRGLVTPRSLEAQRQVFRNRLSGLTGHRTRGGTAAGSGGPGEGPQQAKCWPENQATSSLKHLSPDASSLATPGKSVLVTTLGSIYGAPSVCLVSSRAHPFLMHG